MRAFKHKERWRAADAVEMADLMASFYETIYGFRTISCGVFGVPDPRDLPEDMLGVVNQYSSMLGDIWSGADTHLIFADDSFAEMMVAAAISAPSTAIALDEVISPTGVIFFKTTQDYSFLAASTDKPYLKERVSDLPVRALVWSVRDDDPAGPRLYATLYAEGPEYQRFMEAPAGEFIPLDPNEMYQYLRQSFETFGQMDAGSGLTHDARSPMDRMLAALIRSAAAIARSPRTVTEELSQGGPARKKKSRRNRSGIDRSFRLLSLRNPDYGRYELEAATGRRLRSHWVRGHWRNQWYAGARAHRRIWIDGFVRGDAELGHVASKKVYSARGD